MANDLQQRIPPARVKPEFLFLLSLGNILLNFIYAPASIALGSILMAYMIWQARADYIPAILILPLAKSDFLVSQRGTWEYMVMQFESNAIYFGGFPISINYILIATLVLRVTDEFLNRPQIFRNAGVLWLVPLWYLAMLPALVMSLQGRMEGNPSWTGPIRMVAITGGLFYGIIVVKTWAPDGRVLLKWLLPISICAFALGSIGLFKNMLLWLLTPFSIPLAWMAFRQSSIVYKAMGIACALFATTYALGLVGRMESVKDLGDSASGLLGESTFTLNSLYFISIVFTFILTLPFGGLRRWLSWLLGWPAMLTVVLFTVTVGLLSPSQTSLVANSSFARVSTAEMTPAERLRTKIFDDRSIIWHSAMTDLTTKNPVLLPAGRPLMIDHPSKGIMYWPVGMHNTPLHVLRILRWFSGSIVLLILFYSGLNAARAIGKPIPSSLRVLSAGTLGTLLVGGVTGHYPVGNEVAFFFLAFAGMAAGATASVRRGQIYEAQRIGLPRMRRGSIKRHAIPARG